MGAGYALLNLEQFTRKFFKGGEGWILRKYCYVKLEFIGGKTWVKEVVPFAYYRNITGKNGRAVWAFYGLIVAGT